jgi:hypothetical protein
MGQQAEDIINGDVDEITGEWLGNGQGYPRSYFDAKKYTGEGSVKMSMKRVTEYFKDYQVQQLQGGGLNIKLPGNGTVTVWWRKGKWTHSKNANKWFYFRNAPKEHANELIAQVEGLMGITNSGQQIAAPVASITAVAPVNTTQQCIDHLLKKVATIEKVKGHNAVAMILKTVAKELEQYL